MSHGKFKLGPQAAAAVGGLFITPGEWRKVVPQGNLLPSLSVPEVTILSAEFGKIVFEESASIPAGAAFVIDRETGIVKGCLQSS